MFEGEKLKNIVDVHKIEYMTCQTADSLKSEIRKLIIYHDECGQQLVDISIDHGVLHLEFTQNCER